MLCKVGLCECTNFGVVCVLNVNSTLRKGVGGWSEDVESTASLSDW